MNQKPEMCDCGKPLHYSDPKLKTMIEDFINSLGPTVPFPMNGKTYLVPRHYIALHGVNACDLPELSQKYGWKVL